MRILIRNIMLSVVSLLALSACSNDDSDTLTRVPLTIKATIQGAETRVAYNDDGSGSFTKGDVIYVFCFDSGVSSDYQNGVEYTFDGEKWTTENPFYFKNNTGTYTFYAYANMLSNSNTLSDQSNGLAPDELSASTTCSARNPEAAFSFTHVRSKITLNFTSAVTECKLTVGKDGTTICHLINDGKTAEALMMAQEFSSFTVQVTVDKKIYTGTIDLKEFVANYNYIYNIKISDVLTVDSGTSITGFIDSDTTFEAIQQ